MARRNRKRQSSATGRKQRSPTRTAVGLRIIGGRFRGRKLLYSGQLRTRPMKDRLRQAIFNLIGPAVQGKHVFDLFAGTGALALEALSRGADRATLIEQHYPTANVIRQNIAILGVEQQAEVITGNVFLWWQKKGTQLFSSSRSYRPIHANALSTRRMKSG
jgi:16S rRNA (guanine(966)-N(2))-methyltransferase RsmD